jgi:valyl-tRNA synthetase
VREPLLERGRELHWYPSHMVSRYENWVNGLNGDWCASRQRFFGVPFPVWYRVRADGSTDYNAPLLPAENQLPIDPSTDVPAGYRADQRGAPGGFIGDPDIMDTWATSSLTPFIVCGWERDQELWKRTFPMHLRPQAHDIIRTWLFSTVLRSHLEEGKLPWENAAISGWVLDPDRKKMSKSKGNVVTPMALLEEHGSDAVRYWAARGGPGVDTAFEPGQMKVGRRLAIKLLNASKFVLSRTEPSGPVSEPLDRSMLRGLAAVVESATKSLDEYDYAAALREIEAFFWSFCDDYIELAKRRRARDDAKAASASQAAQLALSVMLRLFAPFLPFVTEEVWSWSHEGSIHRAPWPNTNELESSASESSTLFNEAREITASIRHHRSTAGLGFNTRVRIEGMTLASGVYQTCWPLIESDVLEGNNVESAEVLDASTGSLNMKLSPVAPDA